MVVDHLRRVCCVCLCVLMIWVVGECRTEEQQRERGVWQQVGKVYNTSLRRIKAVRTCESMMRPAISTFICKDG